MKQQNDISIAVKHITAKKFKVNIPGFFCCKFCDYVININFWYKFMLCRQKSKIVQTMLADRCALFIFYAF